MEHEGINYRAVLGSDVVRDGMYLEVSRDSGEPSIVLEIFYSDESHQMTLTLFVPGMPMDVVRWALAIAREQLPATADEID